MTTTIGTESSLEDLLIDLVQLDHDAVGAYDAAIARLKNASFRNRKMKRSILAATAVVGLLWGSAAIAQTNAPAGDQAGKKFLRQAIRGDNSEIELGRLAEQKGGSDAVKTFGRTLVTDHSAARQQAEQVAQSVGLTPPSTPAGEAKREYKKLSQLSGTSFDREFVQYIIKDHKSDIRKFSKEARQGSGTPTARLAKETLPTLKKHLRIAQSLEAQEGR